MKQIKRFAKFGKMRIFALVATLFVAFACFSQERYIVVDKPNMQLYVMENGQKIFTAPIACAKNYGPKQRKGDNRTPEGSFTISNIQPSKGWRFMGRGPAGVYGPWFLRLNTPGLGNMIGIHGTSSPKSIGKRVSHGCIRLSNENITKLKALAFKGMRVEILPDKVSNSSKKKK